MLDKIDIFINIFNFKNSDKELYIQNGKSLRGDEFFLSNFNKLQITFTYNIFNSKNFEISVFTRNMHIEYDEHKF